MRVLKFGGTSLSNAKKFLDVSNIIQEKFKYEDIAIVLSAPAKITNYLDKINTNIELNVNTSIFFEKIEQILYKIVSDLKKYHNNFPHKKTIEFISNKIKKLKKKIKNIKLYQNDIEKMFSEIISQGEIISVKIMETLFIAKKYPVFVINPVKCIVASDNYLNAHVKILESKKNFQSMTIPKKHIIFMPGFIAGNKKKELVTLGRNGSDYSAAILSVCLKARICEIWTDVDGIYTADPKVISHAKLLSSISYQEAMELAFFGAKVLHPKTILPLKQSNIECIIKNTYFPENVGTIIKKKKKNDIETIKGITYIDNVISLIIEVTELCNINFIIKKILSVLLNHKIRILSTKNTYFEKKIFFYIIENKADNIQTILGKNLKQDLHDSILKITINENIKILSIVGSNLQNNTQQKKQVINALRYTDLNIISINNEFSKNAIMIITDNKNITDNINIIHNQIFYNMNAIQIFIIGIGGVGTALIHQIKKQQETLKHKKIKFKICGIANSKKMVTNLQGINLNKWQIKFNESNEIFCINNLIKYTKHVFCTNPVLVDCTSSQEITEKYYDILKNNIHIVTPNKKANTDTLEKYKKLRNITITANKKFLYETNVSAGLPIIKTLKNLFDSGDKLINFQGILSGSLSFIFGKLEEGLSISKATIMAKKLGFTEPNPKDDLSGLDVARKLLILAREAGYELELQNINIIPILPNKLLEIQNEKKFLEKLPELDEYFFNKIKQSQINNKVLRLIGTIEKGGFCQVKLTEVDKTHPLYNVKNGENALIIYSKYYQPMPLVLRGYGAGNNVTAAGIFSDLLQILS